MNKVRKQTYSLGAYLKKINKEEIRSNADVQRFFGAWTKDMINELIVTVLTGDYIPPIILGEEFVGETSQLWTIDGLQRSSSLNYFRNGNYRITSIVENPIVEYQKQKMVDGKVARDENGNIIWETVEFDIRRKTFSDLPEELQNIFDDYQIETAIHQGCNMKEMSAYIRRYNHHQSMNVSERALTYIDNFARDIRNITQNNPFFRDCGVYTQKEKENGTIERVVTESIMATFYLSSWQKQTKKLNAFLNDNASKEEFEKMNSNLTELSEIVEDKHDALFNSKNSFVWFALFEKFKSYGLNNEKFADFLTAFEEDLHSKTVDGISFDEENENKATKDKKTVEMKLHILEVLMEDYLHIQEKTEQNGEVVSVLDFLKSNVSDDIVADDVELYEDILSDLTLDVDNNTKLLDQSNHNSLIGMIAYSCQNDLDLDEWFATYFKKHSNYNQNQVDNYMEMKRDFDMFVTKVA